VALGTSCFPNRCNSRSACHTKYEGQAGTPIALLSLMPKTPTLHMHAVQVCGLDAASVMEGVVQRLRAVAKCFVLCRRADQVRRPRELC